MDRNSHCQPLSKQKVALRKESVDRNCRVRLCPVCQWRSLSARRAWIEIAWTGVLRDMHHVALRKESVDRNTWSADALAEIDASLSARRAWIEMYALLGAACPVA